jgi:hypothetical protein
MIRVPSSWSFRHWWVRWMYYLTEGCVMCHRRAGRGHAVWCRWRP